LTTAMMILGLTNKGFEYIGKMIYKMDPPLAPARCHRDPLIQESIHRPAQEAVRISEVPKRCYEPKNRMRN